MLTPSGDLLIAALIAVVGFGGRFMRRESGDGPLGGDATRMGAATIPLVDPLTPRRLTVVLVGVVPLIDVSVCDYSSSSDFVRYVSLHLFSVKWSYNIHITDSGLLPQP